MKKNRILKFIFIIFLVMLLVFAIPRLFSLFEPKNTISKNVSNTTISDDSQNILKVDISSNKVCKANIVAIGDTLCHSQNFKDAYDSSTGLYDFSPMFKYVSKYFENATVCVGNLEASLAGPEKGYSGYPTFNTPEALATDLKELGLDVMTTANNHALDMGFSGLTSTLNYLDNAGLDHTGSSRTADEQNKILFKDLNGIKTAFLAFTYGTNGIPLPTEKEFCVNLIDKNTIKEKIDQAKSEGAELICVSMHWGDEYKIVPNSTQEDLANFLIENDVQVILGCHPHVLEPMEMKTVTLEDGSTKSGFVIYSMGNFFSAQTFPNTRNTVIVDIKVSKDSSTNKVSVDGASYVPVYVYDNTSGQNPNYNGKDRYELLDIKTIIEEFESGRGNWNEAMYNLAKTELERTQNIVDKNLMFSN